MAELTFDVVEDILVRLDVENLIRCKSVCKSWQSLISCPRFVKAHLNRAYKNDRDNPQLGHRRMAMPSISSIFAYKNYRDNPQLHRKMAPMPSIYDWITNYKFFHIVGSCNGLVCISPTDVELAVINSSTREVKKLTALPYRPDMFKFEAIGGLTMIRRLVCWGFGYDSLADDYKVIVGFRNSCYKKRTIFYVLTLKSNIWKVIGEVKYMCIYAMDGVLCDGSRHWFMRAPKKKVILSLDLSTQEFREIPQPTSDEEYECNADHKLGVMEECLCIYSSFTPLSTKKWVMRNSKWELYNDHCENKYDVAHFLNRVVDSHKRTSYVCSHDDGTHVPSNGEYIGTSIFVKSLVSPHPHVNGNNDYYEGQKLNAKQRLGLNKSVESNDKGNIRKRKRKRKRSKRYSKHKRPLVWI